MAIADVLCDPTARLVIAHRGDSISGGENTLEALRRAADIGADALEFDVRMTKDGVAVLMHDATLDRTTSGRGRVSDYTYDQLEAFNADPRNTRPGSSSVRVPTLDAVLEPPGLLALNYGRETPLVTLFAHVVYGAILGTFLSP